LNDRLKYRIALSLIKGVGPRLARNLIAYLGSVEAVFLEKQDYSRVPGIGRVIAEKLHQAGLAEALTRADREIEFIHKNHLKTLFFTDEHYPLRLAQCDDAPLMLYLKGDVDLDAGKIVSVVGTRRPTDDGLALCEKLIADIAVKYPGTLIVSGLAYGVDICAHRAALKHQLPTVAVLAHGLDRVYPPSHHHTARDIVERGALVSEFLSGTMPDRPNFVRRNRIVAGLCDAVVVVESAAKGGALITAGIAASYSRDVLAFPGRVTDESSKGCNKLIKTNIAAMVESIDDLEYVLGWESSTTAGQPAQGSLFAVPLTAEEKTVMDILRVEKEINLNVLVVKTGIPVGRLSATLLDLEFKGLVKSRPGGVFKLM
jgi:DNA processing protein